MTGNGRVLLIAIPCLLAFAYGNDWLSAQQPSEPPMATAGLVTHVIEQEGRPHTVIVADTRRAVLAVYQVDPVSGELAFKSARNVSWDLQMLKHNNSSDSPSPEDVRSALPR